MAQWRVWPNQCRDRRLPLADTMARTPIHPGEHLAEELTELRISAAELARQIDVPVYRALGSLTVSERSRPIPRCGSGTGSAPARSFGSICKSYMSCAWRAMKLASLCRNFPSSWNASAAKRDKPPKPQSANSSGVRVCDPKRNGP